MNRTIRILGTGVLLVAGVQFAGGKIGRTQPAPQAAQEMTATVKIDNFSFAPPSLQIKAGTKVTWTNADDIPHTVVSDDKVFKSKALDTDDKFSYTFDKPGTYPYFCSLHPKMTAKVVVQ
jgi:plastocyanin